MKANVYQAITTAMAAFVLSACQTTSSNPTETWAFFGEKIYVSPDSPPILDGVVVTRGSSIVAVGPRSSTTLPKDARISSCGGAAITAGFQNSHVHFTDTIWQESNTLPVLTLQAQLIAMLTAHGYTTVVDTGSDPGPTFALKQRIDSGEALGPRILTLGMPIFPPGGIPGYLDHFPPDLLQRFPQPSEPSEAIQVVQNNLEKGAEGTKLFIVTPRQGRLHRMPDEIALAAARITHEAGKLVFAHPTDIRGVEASLAAGVDVLAHTTHGIETPWPDALHRHAVAQGLSLIPTLQLMGYEAKKEQIPAPLTAELIVRSVAHVRAFAEAGGDIIFGTDVGYMSDYDPTEEYRLLAEAGLSPMDILASLTTRPALKWQDKKRGRLFKGGAADLVVLDADPAVEATNFSKVRCTIGSGKVIYRSNRIQ